MSDGFDRYQIFKNIYMNLLDSNENFRAIMTKHLVWNKLFEEIFVLTEEVIDAE